MSAAASYLWMALRSRQALRLRTPKATGWRQSSPARCLADTHEWIARPDAFSSSCTHPQGNLMESVLRQSPEDRDPDTNAATDHPTIDGVSSTGVPLVVNVHFADCSVRAIKCEPARSCRSTLKPRAFRRELWFVQRIRLVRGRKNRAERICFSVARALRSRPASVALATGGQRALRQTQRYVRKLIPHVGPHCKPRALGHGASPRSSDYCCCCCCKSFLSSSS